MKSILVIDDNADFVELLKVVLQKEFEVHACTNPQSALDVAANNYVDVILSDFHLGTDNSTSLLSEILEKQTRAKVFIMSGSGAIPEIKWPFKVEHFFQKPFKMQELKQTLRETAAAS